MSVDKEPRSSTFDNFWEERLRDYPKTDEFGHIYQEILRELPLPERKLQVPVVISLIGIPGTGKSTFAEALQEEFVPAVHLRSDVIAFTKLPQGPDYDYYKAYVIKHALARHYLGEGYSVIMDDNNRTKYNRERVYRMARQYGARNLLFFLQLPMEEAIKRATQRDLSEGRRTKFHQTRKKLLFFQEQIEEPTPEEIAEWDVLYWIIDANKSVDELTQQLAQNNTLQELLD
jgi:predicted kinase